MTGGGDESLPESNTRERSHADVARQTPPPLFQPGDHLPNLEMWILRHRIGAGGFGEVWLAEHPSKGLSAVKFCTDPTARHKLVTHEKAVVARVMKHCGHHPNVVPLLECNLSGEIPWLMYEYVKGGTLAEAIASWGQITPPRRLGRAVLMLHALSGALGTFHQLNPPLVHRDLKPQNVLMAGKVPRITDFGIGGAAPEASPLTDASIVTTKLPTMLQTAGSSRYAPQEQAFGSPPHPRDDVFALGVIAYQMILADLRAAPDDDAVRVLRAQRIPNELVTLITRSVAMDPRNRPKDATEWQERLTALMRKKTAAAPAPADSAADPTDRTEVFDIFSDSESSTATSQTIDITARGRWYSRTAGQLTGEWHLITTTPAEVRITGGEVYRFSIHSAATETDVAAVNRLAGLSSLRYLNLSFCDGVTDDSLAGLSGFIRLRQLFLRGCRRITDAGLTHLHTLKGLHVLELTECAGVTPTGIAAVRDALPECKVLG